MNVGDTIQCHDEKDMLKYKRALSAAGFESDSLFEMDGEVGYWLKITKIN